MSRVRTGGRIETLAHLHKAEEFLSAADAAAESGWWKAAASNAVTAGINAKDDARAALRRARSAAFSAEQALASP